MSASNRSNELSRSPEMGAMPMAKTKEKRGFGAKVGAVLAGVALVTGAKVASEPKAVEAAPVKAEAKKTAVTVCVEHNPKGECVAWDTLPPTSTTRPRTTTTKPRTTTTKPQGGGNNGGGNNGGNGGGSNNGNSSGGTTKSTKAVTSSTMSLEDASKRLWERIDANAAVSEGRFCLQDEPLKWVEGSVLFPDFKNRDGEATTESVSTTTSVAPGDTGVTTAVPVIEQFSTPEDYIGNVAAAVRFTQQYEDPQTGDSQPGSRVFHEVVERCEFRFLTRAQYVAMFDTSARAERTKTYDAYLSFFDLPPTTWTVLAELGGDLSELNPPQAQTVMDFTRERWATLSAVSDPALTLEAFADGSVPLGGDA